MRNVQATNGKTNIYLTIIVLFGCAVIVYSFSLYEVRWSLLLLAFTLMAALIGPASVKIGSKIEMVPVFPFSFCALLLFGITGALFVGIVNALATSLLRKRILSIKKVLFNIFSVSIALFFTGLTFEAICSGTYTLTNESFLSAVLMATLAFYLVNTLLVSGVVKMTENRSFFTLWREKFLWTAPSYFAGSSFSVVFAFLVDRLGVSIVILALPPAVLIYYFYRFYVHSGKEEERLHGASR